MRNVALYLCAVTGLLLPMAAFAQDSLSLSVSPTLFEMTANPGQEWVSNVRVINSNPYDLTVYTDVVNFAPQGESGQAKFLPVLEAETDGQTIAEWVTVEQTELTIPAEQTKEIPFRITVPEDAPPGGHFGALLIGTRSRDVGTGATAVETSQVVTSLVFLRVTGDIVEEGQIREFRSKRFLYESPEVDFELRFQNKGNVHILPQGEIRIFNMWGQERGVVPINRQTLFGNVLPDSIRKYDFTWSGAWSWADIGRYRAEATLAYGVDGRQFVASETSFWVVPWKLVSTILAVIIGFLLLITWGIKLYVRKMLQLAGVAPGGLQADAKAELPKAKAGRRRLSVVAPIEMGMLDLRQRMKVSDGLRAKAVTVVTFVRQYAIFFVVAGASLVFIALLVWYIKGASVAERQYEITIGGTKDNVTISSEELEYESLRSAAPTTTEPLAFPPIRIVNQSGVPGLAASLRVRLEGMGYPVAELTNDLEAAEMNTVIVYPPDLANEALKLSADVYGALTSSYPEAAASETPITIYVGADLENAVQ